MEKKEFEDFLLKNFADLSVTRGQRRSISIFDFEEKETSSLNVEYSKKYQETLTKEIKEWDSLLYCTKEDVEKKQENKIIVTDDILAPSQLQYLELSSVIRKYLDNTNEFNEQVKDFLEKVSEVNDKQNNLQQILAHKLRLKSLNLIENFISEHPKHFN